jgi:DNA topoisomerase-3
MASKKLSASQIRTLICNGRTGRIKGFKSRTGSPFAARLQLDAQWKVVFVFDDRKRVD